MGWKKRVMTALSIVSLLVASVGVADFALADRTEAGSWTPAPGVTCAEVQNAINNLDEHSSNFDGIKHSVRIIEDCSANLVIPSGKTVELSLYSEDENGERTYHSLINDGGDTITVEEGASFYYEGWDEQSISNNTQGRSIINNRGKVHILTGTFKAENGAYTFTNSGELNVIGNNFTGVAIRNTGKLNIAGGTFDNTEVIKPYIVSGSKLSGNRVVSALPDGTSFSEEYTGVLNYVNNKGFPVGYSFYFKSHYPELANVFEAGFSSSDEGVLRVTGSNDEGWTFTIMGVGKANLYYNAMYQAGAVEVTGTEGDGSVAVNTSIITTTCAKAQDAINSLGDFGYVVIRENCAANLVIPSSKKVFLSLYLQDYRGLQEYYTLTDDGGNTITVENGATLVLMRDSFTKLANSTAGKAIIDNNGTVYVSGKLEAMNGAYTFVNSGTLNVLGGNYVGTKVQNNTGGKVRVVSGAFDNYEAVKPYVIDGSVSDEATGTISFDAEGLGYFAPFPHLDGKKLPIGYSFTYKPPYPEYADAIGLTYYSAYEDVLEVTGSNIEGWTFTVVGVGEGGPGVRAYASAGDAGLVITGYEVPSDTKDDTTDFVKYLLGKLDELAQVLRQAIESGKNISIKLEVTDKADGTDISVLDKAKIERVAGNDKILGYYDVNLALNGDDSKLGNITDLGNKDVEVRLSVSYLKDLTPVKPGYRRSYYVIRYHDGVAEKINAKLDGEKLVFRSGKFSTYAVAYTDIRTPSRPTGGNSNIGTGTNNGLDSGNDSSNVGSNSNNGSNAGSSNSNTNSGVSAPDTGVMSIFTDASTTVVTLGVVAVLVIAGGVFACTKVAKNKDGK